MKISSVKAQKILDSRGEWTDKAVVKLEDQSAGHGEVPAGASVGSREAVLVDVDKAVENIDSVIAPALVGLDAKDQQKIDLVIRDLDGTDNKSHLGANATLAASLGVCEAQAQSSNTPLYRYIRSSFNLGQPKAFPTPLFNIINGGVHADNKLDIQEFMVAPATHKSYQQALEMGVGIYEQLEAMLKAEGLSTAVGDEGGFAPAGLSTRSACEFIIEAARAAGFAAGSDYFIALDVAANSFASGKRYEMTENPSVRDGQDLINLYEELVTAYPIIYLEDPFAEDDLDSWQKSVELLGERVDIVGDDLTVTNTKYLAEHIAKKRISGAIVKPNQIGTLTETMQFVKAVVKAGLFVTVSHRSGETGEDTFIADLAVAVGARYIKAGAPARGERVVKYNRLLEIYREQNKHKDKDKDKDKGSPSAGKT